MKDRSKTSPRFTKMEQARSLMDQGQCQESLVLALDVLLEELNALRNALLALHTVTWKESPLPSLLQEQASAAPPWSPPVKAPILH